MKTRVLPVVRKELREIRRDPLMMWLIVAVPLVLLFLFGSALSLDIRNVPMAVLDLDRGIYHSNFNDVEGFVRRHAQDVELEKFMPREAWYVVRARRHPRRDDEQSRFR